MRYVYNKDKKIAYGNETVTVTRDDTGEKMELILQSIKRYGNRPFLKVFDMAEDVISSLTASTALVFIFLIKIMDKKDNIIDVTFNEIKNGAHVSMKSVVRAIDDFRRCDFIRYVRRGRWIVNPLMFIKGDENKLYGIAQKFFDLDKYEDN